MMYFGKRRILEKLIAWLADKEEVSYVNRVKCFDVVTMVTDEATKRFAPLFYENVESKRVLKQYCGILDNVAENCGGEYFQVEVDEETAEIIVTLACSKMELRSENYGFFALARRANRVSFATDKDGLLLVGFVFSSIWEHVSTKA